MNESAGSLTNSPDLPSQPVLAQPFAQEDFRSITLRFDLSATQSIMHKSAPDKLILGYTRTMMGFLILQPKPKRIAMIGLGGGSLAKYCLRHIPDAHFTAVEINPKVIALRDRFGIPPDGPNFQVLSEDGAVYVSNHTKPVDVLLVDGFNPDGQPTQLCSTGFYNDCYAKLRTNGVLVINMLCSDWQCDAYVARIQTSFDNQVVVIDAEESGNKIVFAYKGTDFPRLASKIRDRVRALRPSHSISLHATAQQLSEQFKQLYSCRA
ncbi:MAG: fused MFS/spermidine synthase [Acidithiobacillus ferrooxidans]|nr:fused MFS/spermidine synthase [Acidithiobacillus ferrooxidans]